MPMKAYACPRCLLLSSEADDGDGGPHSCTPTPLVRDLEACIAGLETRLASINRAIYAHGAPLGSNTYFEIRGLATTPGAPPRGKTPEGCTLVAVDTGEGYALEVLDGSGNTIAELAWPESWPAVVSPTYLTVAGFSIRPA